MTNLSSIRSLKTLESMKNDLEEFLTFNPEEMISAYEKDFNWGAEDYEADKETILELLAHVEKRIKSLSGFLSRKPSSKVGNESHQEVSGSLQNN